MYRDNDLIDEADEIVKTDKIIYERRRKLKNRKRSSIKERRKRRQPYRKEKYQDWSRYIDEDNSLEE